MVRIQHVLYFKLGNELDTKKINQLYGSGESRVDLQLETFIQF